MGNSFTGELGVLDELTMSVSIVYCQVIGTMAVMCAMAVYFEESAMRTLMTQLPFLGIMAKHIVVDG